MSQLKFQVNLLSRFFSILPTNFKNVVSRKTRLKFGNTTELCTFGALSHFNWVEFMKIAYGHPYSYLKDAKNVKKKIDFLKI